MRARERRRIHPGAARRAASRATTRSRDRRRCLGTATYDTDRSRPLTRTPDPVRPRRPRPRAVGVRRPRPPATQRAAEPSACRRRLAACSAVVVVVFGVLAARVVQLQLMSGDRYQTPRRSSRRCTRSRSAPNAAASSTATGATSRSRSGARRSTPTRRSSTDPIGDGGQARAGPARRPAVPRQAACRHARAASRTSRTRCRRRRRGGARARTARDRLRARVGAQLSGGAARRRVARARRRRGQGSRRARVPLRLAAHRQARASSSSSRTRTATTSPTPSARASTRAAVPTSCSRIDEDLQWEAEYSLLDQVQATSTPRAAWPRSSTSRPATCSSMASVDGAIAGSGRRAVAGPGEHNAPLTELFEPGSTNKLITLSWAIEHGHVTPDTMFTVPSSITVDPRRQPFYDAEWHPPMQWTTADILRESSNVGTIEIAQRMRNQELADGVRAFGLGHEDGDRLARPARRSPARRRRSTTPPGSTRPRSATASRSPAMQMLDAFATIANGGVTRPPHLLDATIDANGKRHPARDRRGTRVVSAATATTMTPMLRRRGRERHRRVRGDPGYPVAGKTGTSKKLLPTASTPTARRWRRSSASRPPTIRASRRSSCSTNRPLSSSSAARPPRRSGRRSCSSR